ncbi:CrcB family protein [Synechococcus sp. RSCCF101]|uniref:fluoride efflux transporter FluC n=1 Tax=Synechococcus sp. RSCCF101 TaxID=2511069 RepID=UPI001243B5A0|nr:CrcB family protein [Synechococcus sp. RSCCF101]QEY32517.1 CrcB family protein [Synechococcus sp. RSCCF101]
MNDTILVAVGAIPGAWLRLRLVNHFQPMVPRKHWGTFLVNVAAAFALGLVLAVQGTCDPDGVAGAPRRLQLLVATGFFGSLSTFSTFMVELLATLRERHWWPALVLALGSVLAGLLAAALGYTLGRG